MLLSPTYYILHSCWSLRSLHHNFLPHLYIIGNTFMQNLLFYSIMHLMLGLLDLPLLSLLSHLLLSVLLFTNNMLLLPLHLYILMLLFALRSLMLLYLLMLLLVLLYPHMLLLVSHFLLTSLLFDFASFLYMYLELFHLFYSRYSMYIMHLYYMSHWLVHSLNIYMIPRSSLMFNYLLRHLLMFTLLMLRYNYFCYTKNSNPYSL